MSSMAISPNRRYVALAEKTDDGPCIVIYDLASLKRKKFLRGTGLLAEEFVSISFSPDSLYLVAQSGGPDWILTYWQWEKAKRLATVRTSQGNPIHQVSISLHDSTQLCVIGKDTFRTYKYNEEVIKPIGHCKVDPHNFLCHAWINDERIAVGTEKGTWILINNGELLEEHNINQYLPKDTEQTDDKESSLSSEVPGLTLEGATAIATTSNFVYVACGPGLVHCYKCNRNADNNEEYKSGRRGKSNSENANDGAFYYFRVKEIRIPTDPNMSTDTGLSSNQLITQLCINPSEETLIASTASHQLYTYALFTSDLGADVGVSRWEDTGNNKPRSTNQSTKRRQLSVDAVVAEEEENGVAVSYFHPMTQSFHEGKIVGLDICSRKPLISTCSTDHTVRIWNFETNEHFTITAINTVLVVCSKLELYKEFAEEAYSIALHPLGHFILVGFSDKLRLMNLLIDDIRTFKEFPIRGCKECAFSNGGHLFAAVQGNNIQLYSSTSFALINSLKAHNGKIRCLLWSADDNKLISCGMDGAVYEWDPYAGKSFTFYFHSFVRRY
ncbi:unnamed protein product [Hydatigera taeniaeformis]|uniref:WD_REPEATS_REGION domain-containing protein n=1 Tax=Hydatigena taeniaeformis TaxID=6205 RepID=A0A0R3WPC8_HYDTA|nr:unnamed protein product [Hydatigera taeniaeformis]